MENKKNILIGFHSHIPLKNNNKYEMNCELADIHVCMLNSLLELLKCYDSIKANFHLSGSLISYMDKKFPGFSPNISDLIQNKKIELLSGGMYEPILPFIPREDRQSQILMMNRLLNHTYGYDPGGAWVPELIWESSLALDLAKTRIQYTCLTKEHFLQAGINDNEIGGYYVTEEEGRKIAVFPITHRLGNLMSQYTPLETVNKLYESTCLTEKPVFVVFYNDLLLNQENIEWIKMFFGELEKRNSSITTPLLNDYFRDNGPQGRIYLPTSFIYENEEFPKSSINHLIKYHEANLIHKKMLSISKKINSAKEGKSRFKVIKDMINQAHDLLLQGQCNNTYWDNPLYGIYIPTERYETFKKLIKAENLIDSASRKESRWLQISEIDYDCDGNEELIIETDTQNIYISPARGGTILEHDFRPKNLNIINTMSRRKENYHKSSPNNGASLIHDHYPKLNLIDHFLSPATTLENCLQNNLNHLTDRVIFPYYAEKIKAKEENCKIALSLKTNLVKLKNNPEIELKKTINVSSGDSLLNIAYEIHNRSTENLNFLFGVEININPFIRFQDNVSFYLNGDRNYKTRNPDLKTPEEIKDINQLSIIDKNQELEITFSWSKKSTVFHYPIETISFNYTKLEQIYQGVTILPVFHVSLEPNSPYWELSINQNIISRALTN